MIPFEISIARSGPGGDPAEGAAECLRSLDALLFESGRDDGHVLSLTFFANPDSRSSWPSAAERVLHLVQKAFPGAPPPASLVAQAPEPEGTVALEATLLPPDAREVSVERRSAAGLPVTIVTARNRRRIHAAGLSSAPGKRGLAAQARDSFAKMEAVLHATGLDFGHVVRQWNYVEGILDVRSSGGRNRQAYQAFNDVRAERYHRARFPAGYPAATGIGQAAGGVVIEFIAMEAPPEVAVAPLSNPRQVDAWRYSEDVLVGTPVRAREGKEPPKFERAKLVSGGLGEVVFVSGTAAVVGERSVDVGDVEAQTRTTLENIASLGGGRRMAHLRGYVKRAPDIPRVRRVCGDVLGPVPALFVQADVCRDELLVELEGTFIGRPERPGSAT